MFYLNVFKMLHNENTPTKTSEEILFEKAKEFCQNNHAPTIMGTLQQMKDTCMLHSDDSLITQRDRIIHYVNEFTKLIYQMHLLTGKANRESNVIDEDDDPTIIVIH